MADVIKLLKIRGDISKILRKGKTLVEIHGKNRLFSLEQRVQLGRRVKQLWQKFGPCISEDSIRRQKPCQLF